MASFAELDGNNKVLRVIKAGNDIPTSNGPLGENDMHADGEAWCNKFFKGGSWKQTSATGSFRKQLAGTNYLYDESLDMFVTPRPYPGFVLDANGDWEAPNGMARPTPGAQQQYPNPADPSTPHVFVDLTWNSSDNKWEATRSITDQVRVQWNGSTWDEV